MERGLAQELQVTPTEHFVEFVLGGFGGFDRSDISLKRIDSPMAGLDGVSPYRAWTALGFAWADDDHCGFRGRCRDAPLAGFN